MRALGVIVMTKNSSNKKPAAARVRYDGVRTPRSILNLDQNSAVVKPESRSPSCSQVLPANKGVGIHRFRAYPTSARKIHSLANRFKKL
jgi:hypothetical protein